MQGHPQNPSRQLYPHARGRAICHCGRLKNSSGQSVWRLNPHGHHAFRLKLCLLIRQWSSFPLLLRSILCLCRLSPPGQSYSPLELQHLEQCPVHDRNIHQTNVKTPDTRKPNTDTSTRTSSVVVGRAQSLKLPGRAWVQTAQLLPRQQARWLRASHFPSVSLFPPLPHKSNKPALHETLGSSCACHTEAHLVKQLGCVRLLLFSLFLQRWAIGC